MFVQIYTSGSLSIVIVKVNKPSTFQGEYITIIHIIHVMKKEQKRCCTIEYFLSFFFSLSKYTEFIKRECTYTIFILSATT